MASTYIFDSDGLKTLANCIQPNTLFAFNLDSTLRVEETTYDNSHTNEQIRDTIKRLNLLTKVAVFTGASRGNALAALGFEPSILVGRHGAEWSNAHAKRNWNQVILCLKWQERLYDILGHQRAIKIAFNGESIEICHREADDPEQALSHIKAAIKELDPLPQSFWNKTSVSLLPPDTLTKERLVVAVKEKLGARQVIFLSDDEADEDIFKTKEIDVLSIYIGQNGHTKARYYLRKKSALLGLLNSMVGILEPQVATNQL